MRRLCLAIAAIGLVFGGLVLAQPVTITVACGAVGQEAELCRSGVQAFMRQNPNIRVNIFERPADATEALGLYQQFWGARSAEIDVYQIDVIWPGIAAAHMIDLTGKGPAAEVNQHFPSIIANNTVRGKLVAIPWFTDAGMLYYRADLLQKYGFDPPKTWDDLVTQARTVVEGEKNPNLIGYTWQGARYEGLTCDAIEWFAAFGAGSIVEPDGRISVNSPAARAALLFGRSLVGTISPRDVVAWTEEDSRRPFQAGNAVFMRNWPYAWALAQAADSPIRGKVGTVPLPRSALSGEGGACLGGWQLGVSTYSRNQDAAVQLVRFLTGKEEQRRRAIVGAFSPTIPALYQDQEVMRTQPAALGASLAQATARPSTVTGARYNEVSIAFHTAVHNVLTGQSSAAEALRALEAQLRRILR